MKSRHELYNFLVNDARRHSGSALHVRIFELACKKVQPKSCRSCHAFGLRMCDVAGTVKNQDTARKRNEHAILLAEDDP